VHISHRCSAHMSLAHSPKIRLTFSIQSVTLNLKYCTVTVAIEYHNMGILWSNSWEEMFSTVALTKPSALRKKLMCQLLKGALVVIPTLCLVIVRHRLDNLEFLYVKVLLSRSLSPSKNLHLYTIIKRKSMILVSSRG
jgi:hypothetical protein